MKISMKLVYQYMAIFFNFLNHIKSSSSTTSRELRQRLVVDEDDNGKFRLERVNVSCLPAPQPNIFLNEE